MSSAEEQNNFPLVRRASSAVEKAPPGAKRILSGIVEDTLALTKKTPPPRIVLVDDEDCMLKLLEMLIRSYFKDAKVQSYRDGDQALQELMRGDPDLLITDMNRDGLSGWKMLPLLAAKKVNFPILIVSGNTTKEKIKQCAGPDLSFSFLRKPYEMAAFHHEILTHLGDRLVKILTHSRVEDAIAQYNFACCYHRGYGVAKDCVEATKWYLKAAKQNNADAQANLANCYRWGDGVPQDDGEAVKWYCKAAEQGHARAQNNLGDFYSQRRYDRDNFGLEEDFVEAVKWYRKAAEQDYWPAQCRLAELYDQGEGVVKNAVEATKWYRKAAEHGYAGAQHEVGIRFLFGKGVAQDEHEALNWFNKSARQGNGDTLCFLGEFYIDGLGILKKDLAESYKWLSLANGQGDNRAVAGLRTVRTLMSPQDLLEGELRVREFHSQQI